MHSRHIGVLLAAGLALGAILGGAFGPAGRHGGAGQANAQPSLPGAAVQPGAQPLPGGAVKAGRYQFVSSLMTVVMIDTETGKTYALSPSTMGGGPFGSVGEFAWAPITKFDDIENFRKWLKEQRERAMPPFGGFDKKPDERPKPKFEEKEKPRFEDKGKPEEKKFDGGRGATLSGRVTIAGKPWKNVIVSFYPAEGKARSTHTDDEGRYTWRDATPGAVLITLEGKGIPKAYKDRTASPLRTIVKSGDNTYDIRLP